MRLAVQLCLEPDSPRAGVASAPTSSSGVGHACNRLLACPAKAAFGPGTEPAPPAPILSSWT